MFRDISVFQFYGGLTEQLLILQNKIKDFCAARNVETEEILGTVGADIIEEPYGEGGSTYPTPPPFEGKTPIENC